MFLFQFKSQESQIAAIPKAQMEEHVNLALPVVQRITEMSRNMGLDSNAVLQSMRNATITHPNGGINIDMREWRDNTGFLNSNANFAHCLLRAAYGVRDNAAGQIGNDTAAFNPDIYARAVTENYNFQGGVNNHLNNMVTFSRTTSQEIEREAQHIGLTSTTDLDALRAAVRVYVYTRSNHGEEMAHNVLQRTNFFGNQENFERIRQFAETIGRQIGPMQTTPDQTDQGITNRRVEINLTRNEVHAAKLEFMQNQVAAGGVRMARAESEIVNF